MEDQSAGSSSRNDESTRYPRPGSERPSQQKLWQKSGIRALAAPATLDVRPDPEELDQLRRRIQESGWLDPKRASELLYWAAEGSYSTALELVLAMLLRTPKNLSLVRLHDDIRAGAMTILERRLGSMGQRIALRSAPEGYVGARYARLVASAASEPTLSELSRHPGVESVRTLELVAHLVRRGILSLLVAH